MISKHLRLVSYCILFPSLLIGSNGLQQAQIKEAQDVVNIRAIGHAVLLMARDSISRVLPVEKTGASYRIQFESEFGFEPDTLQRAIDRVVKKNSIAESYIIQVINCASQEIIHAYKISADPTANALPCVARAQPISCYELVFINLDEMEILTKLEAQANETSAFGQRLIGLLILSLCSIGLFYFAFKRYNAPVKKNTHLQLGAFEFDPQNYTLSRDNDIVSLSQKEGELLLVLMGQINSLISKEILLKKVWHDEGDYVGRTLDVYISKLRKKLAADPNVKIINVRGMGYRLAVLNQ